MLGDGRGQLDRLVLMSNEDEDIVGPPPAERRRGKLVVIASATVGFAILVVVAKGVGVVDTVSSIASHLETVEQNMLTEQCGHVEEHVDFVFEVLAGVGHVDNVPSFQECCAICKAEPDCQAYTWVKDAKLVSGNPGQCWLKGGLYVSKAHKHGVYSAFAKDRHHLHHGRAANPHTHKTALAHNHGPRPRVVLYPVATGPTTLFCFTVVTDDGVLPPGGAVAAGYERALLNTMRADNLGIFACEAYATYDGQRCAIGDWKSVKNTDIFVGVWNKVRDEGKYKEHTWTVKVDADAVFFPDRLKWHIDNNIRAAAGEAYYLKNIDFKWGFMGALEVLSKAATQKLLDNLDGCIQQFGQDGGEDYFTMQCLDAHGVRHLRDNSLLDDKYTDPSGWHLFDISRCKTDTPVAFHPYKAVISWMGCHDAATGKREIDDLPPCDFLSAGILCNLKKGSINKQ